MAIMLCQIILPLSVDEINETLEEMISDCVTKGDRYGIIPEGATSSIRNPT